MDDPLVKTRQQQIDDELAEQQERLGDNDPDEQASEVVNVDEAMEQVTGNEDNDYISHEINKDELARRGDPVIQQSNSENVPEDKIPEEVDSEDINSNAGVGE